MRRTLKYEAALMERMDAYEKSPSHLKKYVNNRTNSFAELKRIYIFLMGNTKGYYSFENYIKENNPTAKIQKGKSSKTVEWHLDQDMLWDELLQHEKMGIVIKAMRIDSFEELCNRVLVY